MLSPYGHYTFWLTLKLHFWALSLFKYCKISLPFVIEKDELSALFLNYTDFSSKHRLMRVLRGFLINFILTYFKIVYIYKLNFSFYKSRYCKRYSLDTLTHLHLCFKNINFSRSTLSVTQMLLKSQTQYLIWIFCVENKSADGQDLNIMHLFLKKILKQNMTERPAHLN